MHLSRTPPVIVPAVSSWLLARPEFSGAELAALRLDGEVIALDECAIPIDVVADPSLRAAVLLIELPVRLIAEQHTAAWLWGAVDRPPERHEVCAETTARTRPALGVRLRVREVVIDEEDISRFGEIGVTTPIRTAIDLARCVEHWNEEESLVVARLMRGYGFTTGECEVAMNRRRNLPAKKLALQRLREAEARLARVDPVDVIDRIDATNGVQDSVEVRRIAHLEDEAAERKAIA